MEPPISTIPAKVLEKYLTHRSGEVSEATLNAHQYRLQHFVRWCEDLGIGSTLKLDATDLETFREWRREDGNLNRVSLHTQLSTLRVFLQFCEEYDVVAPGLFDKLDIPVLDGDEESRRQIISADRMDQILAYLNRFEYASADHVIMALLWETGIRIGALQSIDVDDINTDKKEVSLQHRPQGGTSLKLGLGGERVLPLSESTCRVISDYLRTRRLPLVDQHDREPFILFTENRPAKSTIRQHVHRNTQPCLLQNDCPHGRIMLECDSRGFGLPNSCPSSHPPHDIRRGAITHWLSENVPRQIVMDRMNVHSDALDKHYDMRDSQVKRRQQRRYLDNVAR